MGWELEKLAGLADLDGGLTWGKERGRDNGWKHLTWM